MFKWNFKKPSVKEVLPVTNATSEPITASEAFKICEEAKKRKTKSTDEWNATIRKEVLSDFYACVKLISSDGRNIYRMYEFDFTPAEKNLLKEMGYTLSEPYETKNSGDRFKLINVTW